MRHYKFSNEQLAEAVAGSVSYAQVLRTLGVRWSGGQQTQYVARIAKLGLDTSHFTGQGHMKGKPSRNRKPLDEWFVLLSDDFRRVPGHTLRKVMLKAGFPDACQGSGCALTDTWLDRPLRLEVDHINGNNVDNRRENLRFLCPNCHSQQPTSIRGSVSQLVEDAC